MNRVGLSIFALVAAFTHPSVLRSDVNEAIKSIRDACARQQQAIETARFTWTEQVKLSKHSYAVAEGDSVRLIPEEDQKYEVRSSFFVSGSKRRFESTDSRWHDDGDPAFPDHLISTFDGSIGKRYTPPGDEKGIPQGTINSSFFDGLHQFTLPLRLAVDPYGAIDFNRVPSNEREAVRSGVRCLVIDFRDEHDAFSMSVWFETERDLPVPVRVTLTSLEFGHLVQQVDLSEFVLDSGSQCWIPSQWNITNYHEATGEPHLFCRATLEEFEINGALPDSLFDQQFLPGTHLIDDTKGEQYVIRDDSSKRAIGPGEWEGGDRATRKESFERIKNRPPQKRNRILHVLLVAVVICGLIGAYRWIVSRKVTRNR